MGIDINLDLIDYSSRGINHDSLRTDLVLQSNPFDDNLNLAVLTDKR